MTYSKVDIANMALGHLGKEAIVSLSENSTEARTASFWYDKAARTALGRSTWTFARSILTLSALTNDYEERWAYKYDIPASAAKIVRLIPASDPRGEVNAAPLPYQRIGAALYCNDSPAKADVVTSNTTPTNWSDDFALAASYLLAMHMAPKLTRKSSYVSDMYNLYNEQIGRAAEHDAAQEPNYYAYASEYLEDRGAEHDDFFGEGRNVDGSIYWS